MIKASERNGKKEKQQENFAIPLWVIKFDENCYVGCCGRGKGKLAFHIVYLHVFSSSASASGKYLLIIESLAHEKYEYDTQLNFNWP